MHQLTAINFYLWNTIIRNKVFSFKLVENFWIKSVLERLRPVKWSELLLYWTISLTDSELVEFFLPKKWENI